MTSSSIGARALLMPTDNDARFVRLQWRTCKVIRFKRVFVYRQVMQSAYQTAVAAMATDARVHHDWLIRTRILRPRRHVRCTDERQQVMRKKEEDGETDREIHRCRSPSRKGKSRPGSRLLNSTGPVSFGSRHFPIAHHSLSIGWLSLKFKFDNSFAFVQSLPLETVKLTEMSFKRKYVNWTVWTRLCDGLVKKN